MANISQIKLPNGDTHNFIDTVSGYTKNTGTITSIKTTAGAHSVINVTSGAANFNVPTTAAHVGIKFGYTTSGNNRAVLQDSSGNLYVTQKDDNTTYSAGTGLSLSSTTFSVKLGYTTSGNNRAVQADTNGNLYVVQKDDNTTYSSKAAASGGTDVSLVTTGEKYTWNSKTSNTGTVTSVAASGSGGITISGSPITSSGTITIGLNLSTAINGLSEGTSPAQLNDYAVVQYAGGGTTTTTYHRRKLSNLIVGKAVSDQNGLRIDTGYLKLTGGSVTGPTTFGDTVSVDDLNAGQLVISGSASVANNLQVNTINGYALSTAKDNNSIAVRTANGYLYASYLNQSSGAETPTTSSYIMYANSDGFLRKSTLANIKSILGLGSNAYTSTAYLPLAGGTMTGALNTANGVANKIGDDVQLGDFNVAGTLGIQGVNGTTGIALLKRSESWASGASLAKITYDGSDVSITKPVHGFISAAHYGGTGNTTKIKININSTATWMLSFVVTLYQGYRATKVMISGYQYGSNYWYQPEARLIADSDGTETISVYFGYDSANNLWVGFDGGNYTGVAITDVVNGYTQITDYSNLFTISNVSALGGTTQTTVTAASKANYANSAGSASSATVATRLAAFSSASTSMTWGNQTGTVLGCYATTAGGGMGFRDNNPSSGQVSMTIDGTVYIKEGAVNVGDAIKSITRSGTTFTYTTLWGNTGTFTQQDNNTTYSAGTGLSLSSTTFSLATSGATAGSYGPSANASPSHGGTFSVPYVTVDTYGRVTAVSTKTITLPADSNTDTKVTQTVTTSNASYPILMAPNGQTATTTTTGYFSTTLNWNPSTKIFYVSSGTTTGNIYMGLATSDTLYTAINSLGWVSSVIV